MGLNEAYEATRRHILMLKPIPSIEDVFNMVAQDERQKVIKPHAKLDNVVFQSSSNDEHNDIGYYSGSNENSNNGYYSGPIENTAYATFRPSGQRSYCTHCGKSGHTIQKCYKIHGYPPGQKGSQRPPQQSFQQTPPQFSNQFRGQPQSAPRSQYPQFPQQNQFQPQYPRANAVANAVMGSTPYIPPPAMTASSLDLSLFTTDQVHSLIQQLNTHLHVPEQSTPFPSATITDHGAMATTSTASNVSIEFPSTSLRYENYSFTFQHHCLSSLYSILPHDAWIVDSGASSHVCFDLAMFSETFPVTGIIVSLPNGTRVPISHTCKVHISSTLTLHNVLYVSTFKFNLISVSSLLMHNKCSAHFYHDSCIFRTILGT